MTNSVRLEAYAKINLCLDVKGLRPDGFHEVAMVMQQVKLHDDIRIVWKPGDEGENTGKVDIRLKMMGTDISEGKDNLAWQAAQAMISAFGGERSGSLAIEIEKHIPVAAGLAGGSSDCAAVLHGINVLWDLKLSVEELCDIGAELGSDVPFCIMGQAAADPILKPKFADDPDRGHCALATGRGTDIAPISGLVSRIVLSKPDISISTAEAYNGIDRMSIPNHPDIEEMVSALRHKDREKVRANMVNVLENFTLKKYDVVVYTKDKMQKTGGNASLMSGSGPTVFCLCDTKEESEEICRVMKDINRETFQTETTI